MKRKRRTIKDSFPTGSLDREELTRAFVELREKRLVGARRASAPAAKDSTSEAQHVRKEAVSAAVDTTRERNRAA